VLHRLGAGAAGLGGPARAAGTARHSGCRAGTARQGIRLCRSGPLGESGGCRAQTPASDSLIASEVRPCADSESLLSSNQARSGSARQWQAAECQAPWRRGMADRVKLSRKFTESFWRLWPTLAVSVVWTVGLRGPGRPGHGAATPRRRPSRPDRGDRPTVLGAAAQRRSGS
jgi:hypothetical protein